MRAIICVGISASGKSTLAIELEKLGWFRIERDLIRRELFHFGQWNEYKFSRGNEEKVNQRVQQDLEFAQQNNLNVILSDTNLNPKYRLPLIGKLKGMGFDVEVKDFHVTLEEAWKRDQNREFSVGRDVIYKQWQQWLDYIGRKRYTPNPELPKAVIFDIDGTLAEMHDRGPFEWKKVGNDLPRAFIVQILEWAKLADCKIIFLSGRDSVCRVETIQWIANTIFTSSGVVDRHLFMRKAGDQRKDSIIKEELFWEHVAPNYNVMAVFDDRPQVVRLWWDLGVPNVICVGNPWNEF